MSTSPAPQNPAPSPSTSAPSPVPMGTSRRFRIGLISAFVVVVLLVLISWVVSRRNSSITDDAFVESHIVNIAL